MDTTTLPVYVTGRRFPDWAMDATRQGARRGLALTDAARRPIVVLAHEPGDDPPVEAGSYRVTVHYRAVLERHVPPAARHRQGIAPALAYAAGRAVAHHAPEDRIEPWGEALLAACGRQTLAEVADPRALEASLVAAAASGFTLIDEAMVGDARTACMRYAVARLAVTARTHGMAALWRGALGQVSRALCENVRFSHEEGCVGPAGFGVPMGGLEQVIELVRWHEGEAGWPFAGRAS